MYPDHTELITEYLETMDDNDYVKSFLYMANCIKTTYESTGGDPEETELTRPTS